jgi:hypothetical protein
MHMAAVAVAPAYRAEFEAGAGSHVEISNGAVVPSDARKQKRGIAAVPIVSGSLNVFGRGGGI